MSELLEPRSIGMSLARLDDIVLVMIDTLGDILRAGKP